MVSINDSDAIREAHYSSMLAADCGLFEQDYDPFLGCTVYENIKKKGLVDSIKKSKNKENFIPEFHFFMPDLNYIKMIRKDKQTLLFYDGRDEEDK